MLSRSPHHPNPTSLLSSSTWPHCTSLRQFSFKYNERAGSWHGKELLLLVIVLLWSQEMTQSFDTQNPWFAQPPCPDQLADDRCL